ncbi:hypothetical protein [Paenibacillus ginsengarvi]|uniref:Uncharacterized protein n=1 Tax=Paenibacillus ginsengarvi TaxID=400777 RepID=A0A3B0CIZ8_9BACL|nr:hypothetical protein [Paenibacillus ginsengarvi]RKN84277.1 hypothetical protein D7M11_14870 [Paenibacillus ginsengarvi]
MQQSKMDGITVLKWVMVIPMFVLSYIVARVFFRLFVFRMIFEPISYNNLQLEFILRHLYDQSFCYIFSIYVACVTAPKYRVTISVILMVLVLITMPRQVEIAREMRYYGDLPWKMPFLYATFIAGGVFPVLIMLAKRYLEKKRSPGSHIQV